MTEQGTTSPTKKPASRSRSSSGANQPKRSHRKATPSDTPERGITFAQVLKMPQGEDNLIYQVQNYLYNRWCGAHQNSATQPSGIELVAYAREKFGPKAMAAGGSSA